LPRVGWPSLFAQATLALRPCFGGLAVFSTEGISEMIRRAAILMLVSGVLAASGCCCGWVQRPFGPGTLCDTTHCGCGACGPVCGPVGDSCGDVCGPACGAPSCDACFNSGCDPCGGPCGPCGGPCGSCGGPCGGPFGWCHPVLAAIFHPFRWGACNGCGDLYLGDFHGDPPDCCDPCNRCGNWTGGPPMGYAEGPVIDYGPGPDVPVAPAVNCPTCGRVHGTPATSASYVSGQPPRLISQTGHVVKATPSQGNPFAPHTSTRTSTTAMVRR
jgi:hypothetical protein